MAGEFDLPCTWCGGQIDATTRHLTVEAKFEEHDPPGHVVAVGYATVMAAYHEDCVPADMDPRRDGAGL